MLIYGSTAIKHWFSDFREPNDLDIIELNPRKSSKEIQYYWVDSFKYILENNKNTKYVDPDLLYTIKLSHSFWDINWEKTMKDISFLKDKNCKIDMKLFNLLYSNWELLHGKKNVKMSVANKDFFTDKIYRAYDHEWLHTQFAFYNRPLNERIRENLNSPLCSKILWDNLMFKDQLRCALEEIYVLSYERFLWNSKMPPKIALVKTLKQMITSTTSGWFALFLVDNFDELRKLEGFNYSHWYESIEKIKRKNSII